jgi:uncharacterized protein YfaT (DUF1175 family)
MGRLLASLCFFCALIAQTPAQVRLADESDRAAFRAWFVLLADAQFYRTTPDVTDCAALVRHAAREALRPHTPEWRRQAALPRSGVYPDVRAKTQTADGGLALFRVSDSTPSTPARYAEFADARTIIRLNARFIGRDLAALRPGDLLYFHQRGQREPDHLMIYVGASPFEPEARDWIVYHTGPPSPDELADPGNKVPAGGEVRKVRLADLQRHPAPRWRPASNNPGFVGVFRLEML